MSISVILALLFGLVVTVEDYGIGHNMYEKPRWKGWYFSTFEEIERIEGKQLIWLNKML